MRSILIICFLFFGLLYSGCTEGYPTQLSEDQASVNNDFDPDDFAFSDDMAFSDHETVASKGKPNVNGSSDGIQLGSGDDVWPNGEDNSGDDLVYGGDGNDDIDGGPGNDRLFGEGGNDIVDGGEGDDTITGGEGDDVLRGGEGEDRFYLGDPGTDSVDGGDGLDRLWFRGNMDWATISLEQGGVPGELDAEFTITKGKEAGTTFQVKSTILNIQRIMVSRGSDGPFRITGNDEDNWIWGRDGDDVLLGLGGDDNFYGWDGNDEIYGGPGEDHLIGVSGDDYLSGGTEKDLIFTREGHGHDIMVDFEGAGVDGGDKIIVYNSNLCFEDLRFSWVNQDGVGAENDLRIEFGTRKSITSLTLLNQLVIPVPTDFNFNWDNAGYTGCPAG